jgi:adenine-specific DNA-methyltransferase
MLRSLGIETSNLYSGFLALALRALEPEGDLVAVTPRSFCNGPYFRPFRRELLSTSRIRRLHVFERRDAAFGEDSVLQENIILHVTKGYTGSDRIAVSASSGDGPQFTQRELPYSGVVPGGEDSFIHIPSDENADAAVRKIASLPATLDSLGIAVSTGRVVDFRASDHLRSEPEPGAVPLLYPCHLRAGEIAWPLLPSRKPNALARSQATESLLHPPGWYVVVKRFSAKEEARRVVASVISPKSTRDGPFAVENHLNLFHKDGAGLPESVARGLAAYLNTTALDLCFREFSGHTQVNAADLRSLRYPSREQLQVLGEAARGAVQEQDEIDRLLDAALGAVSNSANPEPKQPWPSKALAAKRSDANAA